MSCIYPAWFLLLAGCAPCVACLCCHQPVFLCSCPPCSLPGFSYQCPLQDWHEVPASSWPSRAPVLFGVCVCPLGSRHDLEQTLLSDPWRVGTTGGPRRAVHVTCTAQGPTEKGSWLHASHTSVPCAPNERGCHPATQQGLIYSAHHLAVSVCKALCRLSAWDPATSWETWCGSELVASAWPSPVWGRCLVEWPCGWKLSLSLLLPF